jgi:hypothetical protein
LISQWSDQGSLSNRYCEYHQSLKTSNPQIMMMSTTPAQSIAVEADSAVTASFRARHHCISQGGSLPLKKRKLHYISFIPCEQLPPMVAIQNTSVFHKDAALTLLAAASGVVAQISPQGQGLHLDHGNLVTLSQAAEAAGRTSPPTSAERTLGGASDICRATQGIGPSPVTPVRSATQDATHPVTVGSNRPTTPGRVHHPPLASPLPNGCHGRTSRNNSFCRRTPCYNGSTYCKLHYQQYVVAGTRFPHETSAGSAVSEPSSVTSTPTIHQDKRFTGCGGDVRCIATTTRGRACAYICVNDTKYCHLHADYDTNPPPRRGAGSSSSATTPSQPRQQLELTKSSLNILPRLQGCPPLPDLGSGRMISMTSLQPALMPLANDGTRRSTSSVSSDDSFVGSNDSADITIPDASNQRFLSSISSDKWLNRKVKIATGPFVNTTGVVEKWGNGWVTVRIHERLTHNRRSVELFLVSGDTTCDQIMDTSEAHNQACEVPPVVSYDEVVEQDHRSSRVDTSTPDSGGIQDDDNQPRPCSATFLDANSTSGMSGDVEDVASVVVVHDSITTLP